jgi:hypothetical protein
MIIKWFSIHWYKYLFKDCKGWTNFWCRVRGHPGVFWYNVGGLEPDMTCERCGEDLG